MTSIIVVGDGVVVSDPVFVVEGLPRSFYRVITA
jgi:hypothetical protein